MLCCYRKVVHYPVSEAEDGSILLEAHGEKFTPGHISSLILKEMKGIAEKYYQCPVQDAVITVPAYFNDAQRQATKEAGQMAGLNVMRVINEPTAAALAYGLPQQGNKTIAVFDLGGGTFDVSILNLQHEVFEVRSTNGDSHLGGDDVDNLLVAFLAETFKQKNGVDITGDKAAMQRIKEAAEQAKITLSTQTTTELHLPFLTPSHHLQLTLTREELDALCQDVFRKIIHPCITALEDADTRVVDEVLLVGRHDPDAQGINKKREREMTLLRGVVQIREIAKRIFGMEPNMEVNPDEAVALGAAIQAAVLAGDISDVLLLDVTPLSLGIETYGGIYARLIDKNTTLPVRKSQMFSTGVDGQTSVKINIFQGERELVTDNIFLGEFILSGIPPAPRGVPQIEVIFDIDANGIVSVSARDKDSGKEQKSKRPDDTQFPCNLIGQSVSRLEPHLMKNLLNGCFKMLRPLQNTIRKLRAPPGFTPLYQLCLGGILQFLFIFVLAIVSISSKEAIEMFSAADMILKDYKFKIKAFEDQLDPAMCVEVRAKIKDLEELVEKKDKEVVEKIKSSLQDLHEATLTLFRTAAKR
ncbi:HSPA9 [Cordylochernes scorpioides]|uniref:HSPA9 n=1 Tax=Cordylochernes scorpioides TaxID=51811 RepID=A0ABY6KVI9_9ARAC|nr:HSPA9 [Cordylochernes scorpioides]